MGIKGGTFWIRASDTVIRHLRFRNGVGADCVDITSAATNTVIDHCDMLFGKDENFSSFGTPPENMTFQWSANAWGLDPHSCGGLWDQRHATAHHTLWAHNHTRDPKAHPDGLLDWINNVTFDYGIGFIMGDSTATADWKANVEGCYFICPPGNTRPYALSRAGVDARGVPNFSLWLSNCWWDTDGDTVLDGYDRGWGLVSASTNSYRRMSGPIPRTHGVPVTQDAPLTAYKKIVSAVGPLRLNAAFAGGVRDDVSAELVRSLTAQEHQLYSSAADTGASNGGYGTLASSPAAADADRDGMPDLWEASLGSNPAADDHTNPVPADAFLPSAPAGYTLLEEYLHFLSVPHGVVAKSFPDTPTALDADLCRYTGGFTNRPPVLYAVWGVTTGVVSLAGGHVARYEPPHGYSGRARFAFSVIDGDGSSWTQSFAVLVSANATSRDLVWRGDGATNAWNYSAANFLAGTNAAAFREGDTVTFGEGGFPLPFVLLSAPVSPGAVLVSAAKSYTFGGTGVLAGAMELVKSGPGSLTVSNANTYAGGTRVVGGEVAVGQGGSLGGGPVTLEGGTFASKYGATSDFRPAGRVVVPEGESGTVSFSPRMALSSVSGAGELTLKIPGTSFVYDRLNGAYAGFTGTLNVTGLVAGALLTLEHNGGAFDGNLGGARVRLDNVTLQGRNNSGGNTVAFGTLSGSASAHLAGSGYAGGHTYTVGALNQDSAFDGTISDGVTQTSLNKSGSGRFTLRGANSLSGTTRVNAGDLRLAGSLAKSPVAVVSGATLSGGGFAGRGVAVQSGGAVSPGDGALAAGTLTVSNGLALTAASLFFDLSESPEGDNDRVVLQGGTLALTNAGSFFFSVAGDGLGVGRYALITGGVATVSSGAAFSHNLPLGTRQSYGLSTAPGQVWLSVTGAVASLVWRGTASGNWDYTATNWLNAAAPDRFWRSDAVRFDDTATNSGVTLAGSLLPRSVAVSNATRAYTLSGAGTLDGPTTLVKSGSGGLTLAPYESTRSVALSTNSALATLSDTSGLAAGLRVTGPGVPAGAVVAAVVDATRIALSTNATASATNSLAFFAAHTYAGGLELGGGSVTLANDAANATGPGTGPVVFKGGTLTMHDNLSTYNASLWDMAVPAGQSGRLVTDSRSDHYGTLTGGGTLNLAISYVRTTFFGDWSGFVGQLRVSSRSGGADFRLANAAGLRGAALFVSNSVTAYTTLNNQTFAIGELTGSSGATLGPGNGSGANPTWVIGGRNTSGTFAGSIRDAGVTTVIKTGAGDWVLTGSNTFSGGLTLSGGALWVNNAAGSGTGSGSVVAEEGSLLGGSGVLAGPVVIGDGATLSPGAPVGTLTLGQSLTLAGESATRVEVNKATGASDLVVCAGTVAYDGALVVTNLSGALAPGDAFTLFRAGGSAGDFAQLVGSPGPDMAWRFEPTSGVLSVVSTLPQPGHVPRLYPRRDAHELSGVGYAGHESRRVQLQPVRLPVRRRPAFLFGRRPDGAGL